MRINPQRASLNECMKAEVNALSSRREILKEEIFLCKMQMRNIINILYNTTNYRNCNSFSGGTEFIISASSALEYIGA